MPRFDVARRVVTGIVQRRDRRVLWAVLVVWLVSIGTGLGWLMAYDNTPGAPAEAPGAWPAGSALARDAAGPTLVMLAHPRCDCTRASLGELEELLARARQRPRTFVVFIRPGGVAAAWENTSTFDQATKIRRGHGHPRRRRRRGGAVRRLDLRPDPAVRPRMAGCCMRAASPALAGSPASNIGRAALLDWLDGARRRAHDRSGLRLLVVLVVEAGTEVQKDANGS